METYFNIIFGQYFRRITSFCFILMILRRVSVFSSIAMVKTCKTDFGTLWVDYRSLQRVILGYKQNTRQNWADEPGTLEQVCECVKQVANVVIAEVVERFGEFVEQFDWFGWISNRFWRKSFPWEQLRQRLLPKFQPILQRRLQNFCVIKSRYEIHTITSQFWIFLRLVFVFFFSIFIFVI